MTSKCVGACSIAPRKVFIAISVVVASSLLGGCGASLPFAGGLGASDAQPQIVKSSEVTPEQLDQAIAHWSSVFGKDPSSEMAAIALASNLKAKGDKQKAYAVLQQASIYNPQSRKVAAEQGKLAVEIGDLVIARKLLARAEDPANPDWKLISALGAAEAKAGNLSEAQRQLERAHSLAPSEATVLNNLALAYAMDGKADKAEQLLRTASASDESDAARIRQNLALVLGLQGKFEDASTIGAVTDPQTRDDIDRMRNWVKAEPVPGSAPAAFADAWETTAVTAGTDAVSTAGSQTTFQTIAATANTSQPLQLTPVKAVATPSGTR